MFENCCVIPSFLSLSLSLSLSSSIPSIITYACQAPFASIGMTIENASIYLYKHNNNVHLYIIYYSTHAWISKTKFFFIFFSRSPCITGKKNIKRVLSSIYFEHFQAYNIVLLKLYVYTIYMCM